MYNLFMSFDAGIYTEVQQWIKPVMSNKTLHSVFLEYTVPPRTVEKLNDLSQYVGHHFELFGSFSC